jgi:heat shock protein HspQ
MGDNGIVYNAAYIHFEYWYTNVVALNFQSRVLDITKEARLMYEDPWYWIVLENKSNKVVPGARKPRIVVDNDISLKVKVPNAPKKVPKSCSLDRDFDDICRQIARDFDDDYMMDDIEACMKEDDKHLISIDGRYVQTLEKENRDYCDYIAEMQHTINILRDENSCLSGELVIIKEQFVVPLSY